MIAGPRTPSRYSLPARLIHWIMAAGFVFMWGCGYAMTRLVEEDSPLEELLFEMHMSVGVTLLSLLGLRVGVRLAYPPPDLPYGISAFNRAGAQLGHAALYALPAAAIAVGWLEVDVGGNTVLWFGIEIPKVFPTTESLFGYPAEQTTERVHRWLVYTLLGVAIVHVLAVAKHRWFDGHDVLRRMTLGGRRSPTLR